VTARSGLLAIALAAASCPTLAAQTEHAPSRAERDLLRVEAELCAAWEQGDAATLRHDLDPTFTLVDSHGGITGFDENVAEVEKRDPHYSVFRNSDQRVRLYGATAIITGITAVEGRSGDSSFSARFRYTDTWVRRGGGWKLAASHASRLAD